MSSTLMFVCSDTEKCATLAEPLSDAGWEIKTIDPADSDALESIEAASPVATVFDLEIGADQVIHELAKAMLGDPDLPRPLLVFMGGETETAEAIKADIPFGVFVRPDELTWVLKHLIYKD